MPVDRTLWRHPPFNSSEYVQRQWRCPTCKSGSLHLKPETLHGAETHQSRRNRAHEEWSPLDGTSHRFVGMLACNNRQCSEVVAITGFRYNYVEPHFFSTDPDSDDVEYEGLNEEGFKIEYVSPSPPLIAIPENCPPAVKAELEKAFVASWGDFWAAANHARSCVEKLLDYLGEPKTDNLHQRIDNYTKREAHHAQCGAALRAIKFVGNAGSHADDLAREVVYDAFDILEKVLTDLCARDYSSVTKAINTFNDAAENDAMKKREARRKRKESAKQNTSATKGNKAR